MAELAIGVAAIVLVTFLLRKLVFGGSDLGEKKAAAEETTQNRAAAGETTQNKAAAEETTLKTDPADKKGGRRENSKEPDLKKRKEGENVEEKTEAQPKTESNSHLTENEFSGDED